MHRSNSALIITALIAVSVANAQWPALYNHSGYDDEGKAVVVTTDNYVIAVGYVTDNSTKPVFLLYNPAGNLEDSEIIQFEGSFDAVALLPSNDAIAVGDITDAGTHMTYWAYFQRASTTNYVKTIDVGAYYGDDEKGKGIAKTHDNNYVIVAYTFIATADIMVYKVQANPTNPNVLWYHSIDLGGFETPEDVAVDYQGNILICGEKLNSNLDYLIIKCNSSGNVIWTQEHNGGGIDYAHGIATDSQGNVIIAGRSHNGNNYDYWTMKLSPSGTLLWNDVHDTGYNDFAHDVCVDANDNIIVAGTSYNPASYWFNHYIVAYSPSGSILWTMRDDVDTDEMGNGVALAPNGCGFVTGYLDVPTQGFDIYTVRYAGMGMDEYISKNVDASTFVINVIYSSPNSYSINYYLPECAPVELNIYDVIGRRIATLERGNFEQGWHSVQWNCSDGAGIRVPSGSYFCQLLAGDRSETRKLLLVR